MNPPELNEYQSDHDLLVKLNVQVDTLTRAVEKKNDDHEVRIRVLEKGQTQILTWGSAAMVAMTIAQFVLGHFWK